MPACAQLAISYLAECLLNGRHTLQKLPHVAKPDLHLVLKHDKVTIRKKPTPWPTPTSSNPYTCNKLNYRISGDLASAIKFEINTVEGQLNLAWVEWLMGLPTGWTKVMH